MRVMLPSDEAVGVPHCDADYNHVKSELNFWVPLVSVSGSNTLWTESTPGKGDYSPIVARNGHVVRFYGNQCRHFTVPNKSNVSRVSFDLRVIPASQYHTYPQKVNFFQVGQYYDCTDNFWDVVGQKALMRKSAVFLERLMDSLALPFT